MIKQKWPWRADGAIAAAIALAGCGATPQAGRASQPVVQLAESPADMGRVEPTAPPPPPAAVAEEPPPPPAEVVEPKPDPVKDRIAQQSAVQDALQRGDWKTAGQLLRADRPEPDHPDWQLLVLRQAELQLTAALAVLGQTKPALAPVAQLQALADARSALSRAPSLAAQHGKAVDQATKRQAKSAGRALAEQERAAERVRAPAAAWLYHWIGQATLGGKPAGLAKRRSVAEQLAGAALLVQVSTTTNAGQEPVANGGLRALQERVAAAVSGIATRDRLVRVLAAAPRKGQEPWLLQVQIERLRVARGREVQTRTGRYLDRMETVPNPDWKVHHGTAAARLAELNVARDALQPVLDQVNATEARIHQLQEQLAQIMQQVAEDNAKHYRDKPSPCKDKSLSCPQTWGYQRWQPNIAYYQTRLDKENKMLEELAPELARLEAAVAAAQRVWEEAQRKAEETPAQVPQEVWLDHPYEVEVEKLATQLEVRALLRTASGEGYSTLQRLAAFSKELSDFESPAVVVKGQVLQAEHAIALPDDASAVAGAVEIALRDAVLPLLPAVAGHALRWVTEAGEQTVAMQRLERLCRAWLAAGALEPDVRAQVAEQILLLSGFDVRTGTLERADRALTLPQ